MLTRYIEAAMRYASCEQLEDATWYCEIAPCSGVWANEDTRESTMVELQSVLEDWIAVGLSLHHALPTIDGVSIAVERVA